MKSSKNPINGEIFKIPNELDDRDGIDKFLKKNKNKKVVVVQGLGFVGSVMSIVCANALTQEYAVIGVDLADEKNYWKIKAINNGVFPIVASDPKIEEYFNNSVNKNNFYATYDSYSYSKADVIIIDINLDVQKKLNYFGQSESYDVDLNSFKKAVKVIGENCKEDTLIIVETTVPPGTCSEIVYPIIKSCFKNRNIELQKIKIGHSYERVMPGPNYIDSIQNFYRVYSGIDEQSANETEIFLRTIISTKKFPLTRLANTNSSEMAKVLENSYRAMNISFIVEWSRFAETANVNLYEVINAIRMRPTHKNIMYPGIGVGGYCLTKDPFLASWSKKNIFNNNEGLNSSENGVIINEKMPMYAYNFLKSKVKINLMNLSVVMLGVSYRSNVGDTRYSPVEAFYKYLLQDNLKIKLHDPFVSYWEELKINISNDLNSVLNDNCDILIFSTAHELYKNSTIIISFIKKNKPIYVFDMVGLLSEKEIKFIKENNHKVFVLGRGDIN